MLANIHTIRTSTHTTMHWLIHFALNLFPSFVSAISAFTSNFGCWNASSFVLYAWIWAAHTICMYASGCHSIIGIIDQKICETWKIEWNSIMVRKYLCVWMCWPKIYKLAILQTKCHQFWAFLPDISSESIPANKILFVDHTQLTQFNYIYSDCKPFTEIELHSCSACVFVVIGIYMRIRHGYG